MPTKLKVSTPHKVKNILISTGGTGGHIFPAIAIHQILQHKHKISWITDSIGEKYSSELNISSRFIIASHGLKPGIFSKIKAIIFLIFNILLCIFVLLRLKPHIVISFGSNVSAPASFAAILLRIPLIIHEQNAVAGRTNAILSRFAKNVITSFHNTANLNTRNQILLGLPLRREFCTTISNHRKTYSDKICLLVIGGSQGAQIFSKCVPQAISLLPENIQSRLKIAQQSRDETITFTEYEQNTKLQQHNIIVKKFFDNIAIEMMKADLIICRSGASTIAELSALHKPAILVPIKNSIYNHQLRNAEAFSNQNQAVIIEEEKLSPEELAKTIRQFIVDEKIEKREKVGKLVSHKNASVRIAIFINDILMKQK